jgi:hypothetical protein
VLFRRHARLNSTHNRAFGGATAVSASLLDIT